MNKDIEFDTSNVVKKIEMTRQAKIPKSDKTPKKMRFFPFFPMFGGVPLGFAKMRERKKKIVKKREITKPARAKDPEKRIVFP